MKIADDAGIISWISNNDDNSYRKEINNLVEWWTENNLLLKVNKAKDLMVDIRKKGGKDTPLSTSVELRWSR